MKKVAVCGLTNIGMVRKNNEDSFIIKEFDDMVVAAVADGMGGHLGGKAASYTAIESIQSIFSLNRGRLSIAELIEDALVLANSRIRDKSRNEFNHEKIGTTCTVAVVTPMVPSADIERKDKGFDVSFGHFGDSRLYHLESESINQLSVDHTMRQKMIESGALRQEEAETYPHKNLIYKSLDGADALDLDPIVSFVMYPGDVVLLCSDGLTNHVCDAEILSAVRGKKSIQDAADYLKKLANSRGGEDNITIVLLECGPHLRNPAIKLEKIQEEDGPNTEKLPNKSLSGGEEMNQRYGFKKKNAAKTKIVPFLVIILLVASAALIYLLIEESKRSSPRIAAVTTQPHTSDRTPTAVGGGVLPVGGTTPSVREPSDREARPKAERESVKSSYEDKRNREAKNRIAQAHVYLEQKNFEIALSELEHAKMVLGETDEILLISRRIEDEMEKKRREERARELRAAQRSEFEGDDKAFNVAKAGNTREAYEEYLRKYPKGRHLEQAKNEISKLKKDSFYEKTQVIDVLGIPFEFVGIPSGEFLMGSNAGDPAERPVRRVTISSGFWMGKYEVTQGQWRAVMGNEPSASNKGDRFPVENVSWEECRVFIQRLNQITGKAFRLPTEAEWEYASRAGTTGERYGNLGDIAWYDANSGGSTQPVGLKTPNAFGLYDVLGNVWEWVEDYYESGFYGRSSTTDPRGPSFGDSRVARGGSWGEDAASVRAASRGNFGQALRSPDLGLRLILENR